MPVMPVLARGVPPAMESQSDGLERELSGVPLDLTSKDAVMDMEVSLQRVGSLLAEMTREQRRLQMHALVIANDIETVDRLSQPMCHDSLFPSPAKFSQIPENWECKSTMLEEKHLEYESLSSCSYEAECPSQAPARSSVVALGSEKSFRLPPSISTSTIIIGSNIESSQTNSEITPEGKYSDFSLLSEEKVRVAHRWISIAEGILQLSYHPQYVVLDSWRTDSGGNILNDAQRAQLEIVERSYRRSAQRAKPRDPRGFSANGIQGQWCTLVAHPAGMRRNTWVLASLVVIAYELFAITMEPFGIMDGQPGKTIEWVSAIFWALDIWMNFHFGIYVDGNVELRLRIIAKAYIRSWFFFDVVAVALQFAAIYIRTGTFKAIRVVRFLRIGRTLFWLKESACMWYEVGKEKGGWVSKYEDILDASAWHNYLVSLCWALSQLQGNIDLYPCSTFDRCYAAFSSLLSIVVLTLFVSNMTDTLFSVRQHRARILGEERLIRDFFARHDLTPVLRARAEHYLQVKRRERSAMEVARQDEEALEMFPSRLKALLFAETRLFALVWHPTFAYLRRYHGSLFIRACNTLLALNVYDPNDDVFTVGERAEYAHAILHGEFVLNVGFDLIATVSPWLRVGLEGTKNPLDMISESHGDCEVGRCDTSSSFHRERYLSRRKRPVRKCREGQFVCEASLWMPWVHVGDLCSVHHGQSYSIGTMQLTSLLAQYPASHPIFASYAARFVKAAKQVRTTGSADLVELMHYGTLLDIESGRHEELSEALNRPAFAKSFEKGKTVVDL